MFGLSGNPSLDLISIIHEIQKFQLLFIYLIFYNSFILLLTNSKVQQYLENILPSVVYTKVIRLINLVSKSSKFLICFSFVVVTFCALLINHYLGFFVDNFDALCKLYFENKPK